MGGSNDAIMDFFDVISALLNRFEIFEEVVLPQKLSDIFVEILSQFLVVLGVVTKAIQSNRFSEQLVTVLVDVAHQSLAKFVRNMGGVDDEVTSSITKLEKLIGKERDMETSLTLKAVLRMSHLLILFASLTPT